MLLKRINVSCVFIRLNTVHVIKIPRDTFDFLIFCCIRRACRAFSHHHLPRWARRPHEAPVIWRTRTRRAQSQFASASAEEASAANTPYTDTGKDRLHPAECTPLDPRYDSISYSTSWEIDRLIQVFSIHKSLVHCHYVYQTYFRSSTLRVLRRDDKWIIWSITLINFVKLTRVLYFWKFIFWKSNYLHCLL